MHGSPKNVLVIDNDELVRDLIVSQLSTFPGIVVHLANDGIAGLRAARRLLPALVLLDVIMPEMSGLTALAKLRADPETAGLRVVAVTAMGRLADGCAELIEAGFDDCLAKPYELAQLEATLRKWLDLPP